MIMKYIPELNFLTEFTLSRSGMVLELKEEFNIIRLVISQMAELGPDYKETLDRILVMPLRKLLFENQQTPLILRLCPDFKIPKTVGVHFRDENKLNIELAPYKFGVCDEWIPLEDWGKQRIAYYDKTLNDLPEVIPATTFQCILNKLKKMKRQFLRDTLIILKYLTRAKKLMCL